MMKAVKTAGAFHVYLAPSVENARLTAVLEELGLHGMPLSQADLTASPVVVVLAPGEAAPEGLESSAIRPPADAPPAALREILRMGLQNAVLRQEVTQLQEQARGQHRQFEELNRIGIALSAERDIGKLQEFILTTMRQLTNADGASLWLKNDEGTKLRLSSSQNHSLDKDTYQDFTVPVDETTVVGYTVIQGTSQIYDDAYNPPPGKPPGGRGFDEKFGYRTKSMLTVPMRNYNNDVVGAVQLINAKRRFDTRLAIESVEAEVVSFRPEDLEMVESIASQAAVALDNKSLLDEIQNLFDSFVTASVTAIEQRDPATGGHSGRVEILTTGIAHALNDIAAGKYGEVRFNDDQLKELKYACLLHDFGKVGVHEQVLVKAKKLPPGQLEAIQSRFDGLHWSAVARHVNKKFAVARAEGFDSPKLAQIDLALEEELSRLRGSIDAIASANEPTWLPEDKAGTLDRLRDETYTDVSGKVHPVLDPQEFTFLSIRKGTLDEQEWIEMKSHVTRSYEFLLKIRWTPVMQRIPDYAFGHHEKLDGSGYPNGLRASEIPLQTRMMTISDMYDALTARDRPYKKAVPADTALRYLHEDAAKGQLDPDLLEVFIYKRIYELTAGL